MFEHERSLVQKFEGRPFALLGVNVDERLEKLQEAQEKHHLNWRSWWDGSSGPISMQWKVNALPTLFLIDAKGNICWKSTGPPDLKDMDELIEKMVKEVEESGNKQAALSRR